VERKVAAALGPKSRENPHGAGLQVYVPVETYLPANGFRPRTRPLIPGYIFALLPDDDALDIARANHAVREVLCDQGRPVKVRAIDIGAMVLFEATRGFDLTWNAPIPRRGGKRRGRRALRHWVRGQRVPIQEGPFAGFFGEIVKADRADRIEVMVEIFGRASPVELDEEMLGEPQPL
jgi:transcription antitermination factor NusG